VSSEPTTIDSGGYRYKTPDDFDGSQMVGYMPALVAAGEAFVNLEKVLEEIPDEGLTKYHTGVSVRQIVLEIEGDPYGVIQYLDDTVQFLPFNQQGRVEDLDG
jgi:hypothetical protein